jgi:hypothetical protein
MNDSDGRRHRSVYRAADGLEVILDVPEPPMGFGSGFISPPVIEFFKDGAQVPFVYSGWADS